MVRSREAILDDLLREEARLAKLERTVELAQARVVALRTELQATVSMVARPAGTLLAATSPAPQTPSDKVGLFRSLFRGRLDVFPTRFVSRKTGKAGYAPACSNKWEPGLCALRTGGKCSDCASQAFIPVGDRVIADHLQGRHVIGVYPLLEDETCWLLAVDFDKGSWQDDVAAFAETCRAAGIPVAFERSRSGNGAHAWFFFSTPVSANVARRMGCYLITETMSRRHELSMSSYDRLFPNQDTLPRGGFGNLIALPLQHEPRQRGNSVFVDEDFAPFGDQWAYLARCSRIEPGTAEAIASEATRTGQVVGVRSAQVAEDEEEAAAPWTRPPSGRVARKRIDAPLPAAVKAKLAQRLFIEKAGLPSPMLNQLKRIAAFQNPEFYKRQKMRLSTALVPRVISCAEDLERFVALPRGCLAEVEQLLAEHEARLDIDDRRHSGTAEAFEFDGELTPVQEQAARVLLAHETGVFVGPPGIGKTVLGAWLVAQRRRNALVLVHRQPLLEQWVAQLAMFLGIDEKQIGRIGGGKRRPSGRLDVAMIQSLIRDDAVDDLVARYGHVIVDECHHLPAVSFERVLSEVKARYLVGLTATPQRRDGHQPITEMQLGPIRFRVDAKSHAARRPFEHRLIVCETGFRPQVGQTDAPIHDVYRALVNDGARNQRIVDDVLAVLQEGRSPIVLTERKDHLELLAERLRPLVGQLLVLQGGMTAKQRRGSAERLTTIADDAERVVLATGRYIGEGFDDARLDTLFLALPVSWTGTLIQYSGRLHRRHPGKAEVRIYDYVDREMPMLVRMFEKRLATYRAIGYARGEAPLGFQEFQEEAAIEENMKALHRLQEDREEE